MKKLIYSLFLLAMTAMTFTGCEDVPAPYTMPTDSDSTHETPINPSGTGTQDDPFNVAAALNYITAGQGLDQTVYVKGVIVGTPNIELSYGNATYNISDDKKVSDKLVVYHGLYFKGAPFTAQDQIKEGDTLVVSGKLTSYNGTNEFTTGNSIYSINGNTSGSSGNPAEPSGDGTEASPYNIAKAQSIIAAGTYTKDKVYISGIISKISSVDTSIKYGNAIYYVSDDGTATGQLEVYRGYYLAGAKFTSESQIKVGDKVVLQGVLTSYNGTPEVTSGSQLVTLNGSTTGGSSEEGESITEAATDMGFAAGSVTTTTLTDGTALTFDKGSGVTAPAYNTSTGYESVRMYANNTLTITATNKKIVKVSITTTDGYNGTLYNGNKEAYAMSGDTKVAINKASDTQAVFSGLSASTVTIVNAFTGTGGGVQLRIKSITITYAK